jgi:hypothetical protein
VLLSDLHRCINHMALLVLIRGFCRGTAVALLLRVRLNHAPFGQRVAVEGCHLLVVWMLLQVHRTQQQQQQQQTPAITTAQ